jgi:hypothetical protein
VETIRHAQKQGYAVSDFLVTPLPFGMYSSEPKVRQHISLLQAQGQAWCSHRAYFLAGILLEKAAPAGTECLADELLRVMTAL